MNQSRTFNEIFSRYYRRCVLFAQSYVFDREEAESIASDALYVLWQRIAEDRNSLEPLPFLFGVIRNKSMNYLRGKLRAQRAMDKAESLAVRELSLRISSLESCDPHALFCSDIQDIIKAALDEVGDRSAEIFRMSRFDGLPSKDIAERMGIGEKAVEYHISKVLRLLRPRLKDYLP